MGEKDRKRSNVEKRQGLEREKDRLRDRGGRKRE